MRLTIVGGSSPFTALFFLHAGVLDAFGQSDTITLHGRDEQMLGKLVLHSEALLSVARPTVRYECDLDLALADAEVVLVQSRFGGTQWRANVDHVCAAHEIFSDETLGVGGLATAMMYHEKWRQLGQQIAKACPQSLVLNMINPLSLSCHYLAQSGARVVGLCEGPWHTALTIAHELACPVEELSWQYTGLNHRGYLHSLRCQGMLVDLRTVAKRIPQFTDLYMHELDALQSKELRKSQVRRGWRYDRATAVASIRGSLADALTSGAWTSAQLLESRPTPWYPLAVLPFLAAWSGRSKQWCSTANVERDGLFVESRSVVSRQHLSTWVDAAPNASLASAMDALLAHERQCLQTIERPTPTSITSALARDPTMMRADIGRASKAVEQLCHMKASDHENIDHRRWAHGR